MIELIISSILLVIFMMERTYFYKCYSKKEAPLLNLAVEPTSVYEPFLTDEESKNNTSVL